MRRAIQTWVVSLAISLGSPAFAAPNSDVHDVAAGGNPALVSDQKRSFYAAFERNPAGSTATAICFTKSVDGGSTWSASVDVSNAGDICKHPAIALDKNGAITVTWSSTTPGEKASSIRLARSTDGGKDWSKAVEISHASGICSDPRVAAGPDNSIHVVWQERDSSEPHAEIHYCQSTNGGHSWSKPVEISNTPGIASEPAIATDANGIVHVVWLDTTPGASRPDIYHTQKMKGSWSKATDVSNSPHLSAHPAVACAAEKTFVAWSDNSLKANAADIWCAISEKPGEFSKPLNLSDTPGVSSEPKLAVDGAGRLAATWSDTSDGAPSQNVFTTVSFDGLTQVSSALDLTNTKRVLKHPDVALGSDNAVYVWEETDGQKSTLQSLSRGFPRK